MSKLQIEHVSKRYWREKLDREVIALEDINLSVNDGEKFAVTDREVDILQRDHFAIELFAPVSLGYVLDLQLRHLVISRRPVSLCAVPRL